MGDPATPTPKDRAETRALAARIVESVRNDEAMPLGLQGVHFSAYARPFFRSSDVEDFVMQLAQEVCALQAERDELAAIGMRLASLECDSHSEERIAALAERITR